MTFPMTPQRIDPLQDHWNDVFDLFHRPFLHARGALSVQRTSQRQIDLEALQERLLTFGFAQGKWLLCPF